MEPTNVRLIPSVEPQVGREVGAGGGRDPSGAFPAAVGEWGSSAFPASSLLFPNTSLSSARVASAPALVFINSL